MRWLMGIVILIGFMLVQVVIRSSKELHNPEMNDSDSLRIEFWYGEHQRFGQLGHPQRWVNVLGHVSPASDIETLTWSLNDSKSQPLSFREDKKRLACDGDFNVEIDRSLLKEVLNQVTVTAADPSGRSVQRTVTVEYFEDNRKWPLPYSIQWSKVKRIGDAVQVVDGKWIIKENGVRTVERYYDRVLAFGDDSWRDYEVTTTVIFHAFTPPKTDPNTTGVTHAAIASRWPGHDFDPFQPHVKWYPLGATSEFRLTKDLQECRWRIFDGKKEFYVESERRRKIELGKRYSMKHRVETLESGNSRYRVKLWPKGQSEPSQWDLERIETDDLGCGSALLIAHHADVTFGDVFVDSVETIP